MRKTIPAHLFEHGRLIQEHTGWSDAKLFEYLVNILRKSQDARYGKAFMALYRREYAPAEKCHQTSS